MRISMWKKNRNISHGVRLKCYCAFCLVCCGCGTSYIMSVHIQCQASKYTLSLCRGLSWRLWLAKQETLTPPGHLVSPLVCRGPWMSTVMLYCWCHSNSASLVLFYFSLLLFYLFLFFFFFFNFPFPLLHPLHCTCIAYIWFLLFMFLNYKN